MSKSQGASSVIPGPMPNKGAPLRLVSSPESENEDGMDVEERTIVSAISRDMLGLTDDSGAATKTYQVPRELLELARARVKAHRASSRPPAASLPTPVVRPDLTEAAALETASVEQQLLSLGAPPIPTGISEGGQVDLQVREQSRTSFPELEVSEQDASLPPHAEIEVEEAPLAKPSRKFMVTKWLVLASVYVAIVYSARMWLPIP